MYNIWECLTEECQDKLDAFQWKHYQRHIKPPAPPQPVPEIEPIEELDRMMKEPPRGGLA